MLQNKAEFEKLDFYDCKLPKFTVIQANVRLVSWKQFEKHKKIAQAYMYFKQSFGMNHLQSGPVTKAKLKNILEKLKKPEDIVQYHIKEEDFIKYLESNGFYLQNTGIGFSRRLDVYISDIKLHKPKYPSPYRLYCFLHRGFLYIDLDPNTNENFKCSAYQNPNEAHSYTISELEEAVKERKIQINNNYLVEIHDIVSTNKIKNVSIDNNMCDITRKPHLVCNWNISFFFFFSLLNDFKYYKCIVQMVYIFRNSFWC